MRHALLLVLVSQLAHAEVDGGTPDAGWVPEAIAVESAVLRPLAAPALVLDVGEGVYLPQARALEVGAKVKAYDDAQKVQQTPPPVAWVVAAAIVVAFGGGVAVGWWAESQLKR